MSERCRQREFRWVAAEAFTLLLFLLAWPCFGDVYVPAKLSNPSTPKAGKYITITNQASLDDVTGGPRSASLAVRGEVLVRFKPALNRIQQQTALGRWAANVKRFSGARAPAPLFQPMNAAARRSVFDDLALVQLNDSVDINAALEHFRRQPGVAYAEPNYRLKITQSAAGPVTPDDFDFAQLWGLHNVGQGDGTAGADIRAPEAWQYTTGDKRVIVAVIDTGIDYYHPDLAANIWTNPREVAGNGSDDDANGFIDDVHGYDFVSEDADPMDDHGHGTHVSGTIGAVGNNGVGVAGICWQVSLMALKAFDETGNGDIAKAVEAIHYAIANRARIINASWGSNDRSRSLEDALQEAYQAGIVVIGAAGNDNSENLFFPAAYPHVVGVAATDAKDRRARFSDFGAYVDVAAPGENIYSTIPNASYEFYSGTSMAAPHVSGVAALVLSRHPEFTPDQVINILRNSVDPIATDKPIGTGRIDAAYSVRVNAPLPEVKLTLPATIYGNIDISGSATGDNFINYSLEYGKGTNPTNWTAFFSSGTPVPSGALFQNFSTPKLGEGTYTFRLTAHNAAGERAVERASVQISNVHISSPKDNDIVRAGDRIAIVGTVFGENRTYRVEYAMGTSLTGWSDLGMELATHGVADVREGTLATWDTTAIPADQFYTLRLTATAQDGARTESLSRLIYLDSHLKPGWPQYLPIAGDYPKEDWRYVTVADLDNDGRDEIVVVDHGNSDGAPARLLVYRSDGSLAWSKDLASGYPYADVPVVGDADGDGFKEIFVDVGSEGQLFAFRHDGNLLAGNWPVHVEATSLGKVLADLDGDGKLELIGYSQDTVNRGGSEYRELLVWDFQGNLLREWDLPACSFDLDAPRIFPAVGNLDDERDLEIVAVSGCDSLSAFKLGKSSGPIWTAQTFGTFVGSPVVGDLAGKGTNDVVIAAFDVSGGQRGGVYAFDNRGARLPGWPVLLQESFAATPALGDLDGDGQLEICIPSWKSSLLHLIRRDGFEAEGWPVGPVVNSTLKSSAVLGDVDGDGHPDVILSSPGYMSLVVSGGDLTQAGGVKAWDYLGRPIPLTQTSGLVPLVMESSVGTYFKAAPVTVADIDHNGKLDLVATSIQDRTYLPYPEKSTRKNRSSIYAWELPAPYVAGNCPWPAFQGNPEHTGYLPPIPHVDLPPEVGAIPNQIIPTGGAFFPIELDQYVDDPDNAPKQLSWSVSGFLDLRVTIDSNRVARVQAPSASWAGLETVQFTARDPAGQESSVLVSFEARQGYVPPVAGPDRVSTREDTPVEIDVLANDADPAGNPLSVASFSRPLLGKLARTLNGTLVYAPKEDANGLDTFSYVLTNGKGGISIGSVSVEIAPVNDPPVANADHVLLDEDATAEIDVLANDTDVDGDPVILLDFTQPQNGSLTKRPDNVFLYQPRTNYFGMDTFTYNIGDGQGGTNQGIVTIMVKPVNDLPVADDQSFVLNKNASQNITFAATDPDDNEFSFSIVESPKHGTLWNYPKVATYYPTNGFSGTDSFTYRANDGKDDGPVATVQLTVLDANNPPDVDDQGVVTKLDQPVTIHLSATDLDEDPVTFQIVAPPTHGALDGSGTNYVYHPNAGFLGRDAFTYQASDGKDVSRVATVNLTVTDQNTAPVAEDFTFQTLVNTPTNITLRATDPESNPLNFHIVTRPINGKLTGKGQVLLYSPAAYFMGSDRFTFKADDGELDSNVGTVLINIVAANHPPVTTNQDVLVVSNASSPILLKVQDADGDPLNCPILKGPKHGLLSGLGTRFVYTPKPDFLGGDSFTYKAWDGHTYSREATVSISVAPAPPPQSLAFQSVSSLPGGEVRLILTTPSGKHAQVLVSTNLVDWEPLPTSPTDGGVTSIIDADATQFPHRFYRARQQ